MVTKFSVQDFCKHGGQVEKHKCCEKFTDWLSVAINSDILVTACRKGYRISVKTIFSDLLLAKVRKEGLN